MHYSNSTDEDFTFLSRETLKTIFLHKGSMDVKIFSANGLVDININENQGLILLPNVKFSILNNNTELFSVQSKVTEKSMVEIIDEQGNRFENNIEEFKLIEVQLKEIVDFGFRIKYFKEHSNLCLAGEDKNFISKFMTKDKQTIFKPALARDIFSKEEIS